MHHFTYRDGILHAEDVALPEIAAAIGTPFYCYSAATLTRHYQVFRDAFTGLDPLVAYSVKALSNLAVLTLLAKQGAGADIVSGGELIRALKAGIPGERIVFSGVGKTSTEMAAALDANIYQFNVESEEELAVLNDVAHSKNKRAPITLRVNPDVSAGGHAKISTGSNEHKFGIGWNRARAAYAVAEKLPAIDVRGIDIHIGSQITELEPFRLAFEKVADLVSQLRADGSTIDRIDLGGGIGIVYEHGTSKPTIHPNDYAMMIRPIAERLGVRLVFEPGRMIAGNAGILVSQVLYVKQGDARRFLIVDAAMNDLIRPALYDAHHDIIPVHQAKQEADISPIDVVGPVCESGDTFAKQRPLPDIGQKELIAFLSAGAYGAVQASQYNSRPLVPEVLISGDKFHVIRKRPTMEEVLSLESVPNWIA